MEIIKGGVTSPAGFKAASTAAGIKYQGRTDMAMVASDVPCECAGTFTSNVVKAACVLWDKEIVESGRPMQAVVVNSGIANACTGEEGFAACRKTAEAVTEMLGIPADTVGVASTGVIGMQLPVDKLVNGVKALSLKLDGSIEAGTEASKAIMTTDTVNKEYAVEFDLPAASGEGTVTVRLGGMSKGSGMIHPNMCTMLGYLGTDCAIDPALLQKALSAVIKDTFNMITVDGDTSTNDTLLLLSSGLAGNKPITAEDESYELFCAALFSVCHDLARLMASDGEGATHLIETRVFNADTKENARILARSVVGSSLVKAMIYGKDANCGRVLCALGYAGPDFNPADITITMTGESGSVCFYKDGCVQLFDEDKALEILSEHDVHFDCDMNMGSEEATAFGCDLTYDYVKINGDYRT